jgi:hypothetical protein
LNGALGEIEAAGGSLTFVGQATPRHAAHFRRRFASDIQILADEERETYKAMGLKRGSAGQLIGPKSVLKGLGRAASGATKGVTQGRVIGDAAQLGGTFIVLPSGEIAWSYIAKDASDNATADQIVEALNQLG